LPADAVLEVVERFDAASYEPQKVEGHWRHQGVLYRDNLAKIIIDVPDDEASREWMRDIRLVGRTSLNSLICGLSAISSILIKKLTGIKGWRGKTLLSP
jgi:hypothetical protein